MTTTATATNANTPILPHSMHNNFRRRSNSFIANVVEVSIVHAPRDNNNEYTPPPTEEGEDDKQVFEVQLAQNRNGRYTLAADILPVWQRQRSNSSSNSKDNAGNQQGTFLAVPPFSTRQSSASIAAELSPCPTPMTPSAENEGHSIGVMHMSQKKSSMVIAAKVNGLLANLNLEMTSKSIRLEPIYMHSVLGYEVIRRSLVFLLAMALRMEYPEYVLTVVQHAPAGYLCEVRHIRRFKVEENGSSSTLSSTSDSDDNDDEEDELARGQLVDITEDMLDRLGTQMRLLVDLDLSIWEERIDREKAIDYFRSIGCRYSVSMIQMSNDPLINVNRCSDMHFMTLQTYHRPLVSRTGMLSGFDLGVLEHGLVLKMPRDPFKMTYAGQKSDVIHMLRESNNWSAKLGIGCAGDLNQMIRKNNIRHCIQLYQTLHYQKLAAIAHQVQQRVGQVKLILLAGPSASGKTTSSQLLALQLEALGIRPMVLSVDNYYKANKDCPLDENGNRDFECLEALRVDLLNEHINLLFAGKTVEMPIFDFKLGKPKDHGTMVKMKRGSILIMEGIHCLNPDLTNKVPPEALFKIFVAPFCQLGIDEFNFVSGTVVRVLRRMVRDRLRRGHSADHTLSMWSNVRRSEHMYIFPFMKNADVIFNTALDYEFCVLKVYAEPLLKGITTHSRHYNKARELLYFLKHFDPIPHDFVPDTSLLREFVGGSYFEDVH